MTLKNAGDHLFLQTLKPVCDKVLDLAMPLNKCILKR